MRKFVTKHLAQNSPFCEISELFFNTSAAPMTNIRHVKLGVETDLILSDWPINNSPSHTANAGTVAMPF